MREIFEKIMGDGATFSVVAFSLGSAIALIIALPFIIKDYFNERKRAKEEDCGRSITA